MFDEFIARVKSELTFIAPYKITQSNFDPLRRDIWVDITPKARRIFGDIVTQAWQEVGTCYTDMDESWDLDEELDIIIDNAREAVKDVDSANDIDVNATTVEITFVNGVTIQFHTSEWGWIKKVEEE
jgi:hypothetical protein